MNNIFAGLYLFGFSKYGHILCTSRQNPKVEWPQAPAWHASPWGHRPSSSAPCVVPMRLSRIDQHIEDEPCAKQRASHGLFSSRSSSVSRGVRSAVPIFIGSPLVPVPPDTISPIKAHVRIMVRMRTKFSVLYL